MHVEVRTDNHIHGSEKLFEEIAGGLKETLKHHEGQITRVEVHLADAAAPTLIRENDHAPALYVLMPMRV